jgi:signal transduction histidine kinase
VWVISGETVRAGKWDKWGKRDKMEWIVFGGAALLFAASVAVLLYVRKGLVQYTTQLMYSLDAILAGEDGIDFREDREMLNGKLQAKLNQLNEVIEQRAGENLRQRELLEAIISDISHQVKTPIASIRMYHDLLGRKELGKSRRAEFLGAVGHQVDKLEFFMKSMIRMSRLETGIVQVQPKQNPVYELIAQAVCDVALKAEKKKIDIVIDESVESSESDGEKLSAYFDARWTAEAVFNILDNSVKYTQDGGKIVISARKTDFFVRIGIRDNGRGIAEARIPLVFKRFYREPESADVEGVGIGLYLAREIVMNQRGFIEVHSREGEGTAVFVNLPVEIF